MIIHTMQWNTSLDYYFLPIWSLLAAKINALVPFAQYRYFSAKSVTLRFTGSTTAYHAGLLAISYCPGARGSSHLNSQHAMLQFPTQFMDASQQTVLEMEVPWSYIYPRIKAIDDTLGAVYINQLTRLRNTADPSVDVSTTLTIQACFNDPKLEVHTDNGVTIASEIPGSIVAYPTVAWSTVQSKTPAQEARGKAKAGTLTGVAEAFRNTASVLKHIPFISAPASTAEFLASSAKGVFEWFGLSKPITDAVSQFVIPVDNYGENHFHGVSMAHTLSSNPQPYVATDPSLVADKLDPTDIYDIAKTPAYFGSFAFPASGTTYQKIHEIPVHPMAMIGATSGCIFGTHVGYIASMFKLWTGSMKYKFKCSTSPYVRARLIATWTPKSVSTYSDSYRSEMYTINGSTDIEHTVAYDSLTPYLNLTIPTANGQNLDMSNGFLTFWIGQTISTTAATAASDLQFHIFVCGGDDIAFAKFLLPTYTSPRVSAASFSQGAFGATSGSELEGIVDEDNIVSIREMAKRRVQFFNGVYTAGTLKPITGASVHAMMYLLRKYKYYRGSLTINNLHTQSSNVVVTFGRDAVHTGPFSTQNSASAKSSSFVIPFINRLGYASTSAIADDEISEEPFSFDVFIVGSGTAAAHFFMAFNDDLSLGQLLPSPLLKVV